MPKILDDQICPSCKHHKDPDDRMCPTCDHVYCNYSPLLQLIVSCKTCGFVTHTTKSIVVTDQVQLLLATYPCPKCEVARENKIKEVVESVCKELLTKLSNFECT